MKAFLTTPMLLLALLIPYSAFCQPPGFNYDESQVPAYTLPDPLRFEAGHAVASPDQWPARRAELMTLFAEQMYGVMPPAPSKLKYTLLESSDHALDGLATRKQVRIFFGKKNKMPFMDLLIYLPRAARGPVPIFLAPNFKGNHTVHTDPAIFLPQSWMANDAEAGVTDHRASEKGRGIRVNRWSIEMILQRGYGVATVYYGDIDPDYDDGFQNGIHPLFYKKGQHAPEAQEWGSIAAWAWGLSRGLDYLLTDPAVNGERVILMGHSRLGKAAMWAGATDERFAAIISNDSGCGGAAISRRKFGETVQRINTSFPHWFCDNFTAYNDREETLPFDQHQLVALMAPRPVLVCSAVEDQWADPKGEFLSCVGASPVYELLGLKGIGTATMPGLHQLTGSTVGYHIRAGGHDVTEVDWKAYIDFADKNLPR
jgi:hypothetical protein